MINHWKVHSKMSTKWSLLCFQSWTWLRGSFGNCHWLAKRIGWLQSQEKCTTLFWLLCIRSLVKIFNCTDCTGKKWVSSAEGSQENICIWDRGYLCYIASQPASQSKMVPNVWNHMASRSIPLGHKTLRSDFHWKTWLECVLLRWTQ